MKCWIGFLSVLIMLSGQAEARQDCRVVESVSVPVNSDERMAGNSAKFMRLANGLVYFAANMDKNTDGAPKSYHPEDTGASNILCNGINMFVPSGWSGSNKLVAFTRALRGRAGVTVSGVGSRRDRSGRIVLEGRDVCRAMMTLYREAKSANFEISNSLPQVRWPAVAVDEVSVGRKRFVKPCIQTAEDPAPGYFVSTTAYIHEDRVRTCDVKRYVNSDHVSGIVLPDLTNVKVRGETRNLFREWQIKEGRPAVVVLGNQAVATFVSDTGPANRIGEGSPALLQRMGSNGAPISGPVHYFVYPRYRISSRDAYEDDLIEQEATAKFSELEFSAVDCLRDISRTRP
jgi:hypothetical protein